VSGRHARRKAAKAKWLVSECGRTSRHAVATHGNELTFEFDPKHRSKFDAGQLRASLREDTRRAP
jgi:hypothetical protein